MWPERGPNLRRCESVALPHATRHQQEQIVDVGEDEEEKDGAEEHGHPGAMILPEHFQTEVSTCDKRQKGGGGDH